MAAELFTRTVSSLAILFLVALVTFFFPNWVFCVVAVFFIGFSLYEFFSIVERNGFFVYKYFGIVAGCVIPIATYLHLGEGYENLEPFFIVIACLFAFVLQITRKEHTKDHLASIAITLFALFYISWFFSFFIKIKYLPNGTNLIAFLILVTKSGDVGAYLIGKRFGRTPLIPRISPRKTREGAIGGLISSLVMAVLSKKFFVGLPIGHTITLGLLLGVLGQVGDLAESLLKRDFDVKDSGENIGGLGGILDIVDSLLFTTPIFYFYVKILLP